LDTTPPVITFVYPTPYNEILNQSWVFINLTLNENASKLVLEWNGVNETIAENVSNTNFFINKTDLAGNYTFRIYA